VLDDCRVRISTQAWLGCAKLCFRSLVLWPAVFNVLKARWKQLESFDSRKQLKTEDIDSQETDPGPTLVRLQGRHIVQGGPSNILYIYIYLAKYIDRWMDGWMDR
jgi:hypothetical protein